MGDVPPEEWDGFHDFVIHDEFGRVGGIGSAHFISKLYACRHLEANKHGSLEVGLCGGLVSDLY